jgi:C4-dicarboxylate-specific signal transduction histidine kinase
VLLLQALLIAGLLHQRHRRQLAEIETRQRTTELARMNRRAVAGEMSATIAHELSQPLTAILSNAEAAHDLLGRKDHDPEAIREIVVDIIDEETRAADVIDRLRSLLRKNEGRSEPIDLNDLVNSSLRLLHSEIIRRKANVETALTANLPAISGRPGPAPAGPPQRPIFFLGDLPVTERLIARSVCCCATPAAISEF